MSIYINYNGKFFSKNQKLFNSSNRAFSYGDGIFESIKIANENPVNIERHYNRLINSAYTLNIKLPEYFTISFFTQQILNLVEKNNHYPAARVRFTLFRDDGGLYQPLSNEGKYLIESNPLKNNNFILNSKGLKIGIYDKIKKLPGLLSGIKSCNALIYIMAKLFATDNGLDDSIILNEKNNLVEATSSNIFIVKNYRIYTPSLDQGCVYGTMRDLIISIAKESEYKIDECIIEPKELDKADEIFLTNSISGIKWVAQYKENFFSNKLSSALTDKLNKKLINEINN